jgi:hypothetical protein
MKTAFRKLLSCLVLLVIFPMTAVSQTGDEKPKAIKSGGEQSPVKERTGVLPPKATLAVGRGSRIPG